MAAIGAAVGAAAGDPHEGSVGLGTAAPVRIPLADVADRWLADLALPVTDIDGATLLGERAMLNGFRVPARVSAGGGCRLYRAIGGSIALNLARADDRDLLPALFECADLDPADDAALDARIAASDAGTLVARGRMMGLAIAADREVQAPAPPLTKMVETAPVAPRRHRPLVVDLSALWAGPLAAHLLALGGAAVVKVESRRRPDRMRHGDAALFDLLNQGKASIALDFTDGVDGRRALLALIARADIVVEAARPRALAQLGIDAAAIVEARPGLLWITITAHGAAGAAADWVGFGDDVAIAAGLGRALKEAGCASGFVGDAIADPLTGLFAARAARAAWDAGRGGRLGISMRGVAADALAEARAHDPFALAESLRHWHAAIGRPFPTVRARARTPARPLGADTDLWTAGTPAC